MTLQLADSSVRLPLGIVEDVPVLVGKFYVPVDFVVMEMEEDKDIPIILGRPFLKTTRTLIDVETGTLTLRIGDEKVEFNLHQAMKCTSEPEKCCWLDAVDQLAKEQSRRQFGPDGPDTRSMRKYSDYLDNLHEEMCAAEANFDDLGELECGPDESHTCRVPQSEGLERRERGSDDTDAMSSRDPSEPDADRVKVQTEPPTPELKSLPARPRNEFPDPHNSCLAIFNANLDLDRNLRFLTDLKTQQAVIENLIGKLSGKNQATHTHKTSPEHTDGEDLQTSHARAAWSVHSLPWQVATQRWSTLRPEPPDSTPF
jgi:hypothetical protein